jgi:hypothetical protein
MAQSVILSDDALAFFSLSCDLFPVPESPLRYLEDDNHQPSDMGEVFEQLVQEDLVDEKLGCAREDIAKRLSLVGECDARIVFRRGNQSDLALRDFYCAQGQVVEYRRHNDQHHFGPLLQEEQLGQQLAQVFPVAEQLRARPLRLSPGDYLVFSMFARDIREEHKQPKDDEVPMSVEEVLAFFEDGEQDDAKTNSADNPSTSTQTHDDDWRRSVDGLLHDGVLVKEDKGYALHPSLHALAAELVADQQHALLRFDFLDGRWLVREASFYPTLGTVYQIGSQPDGSVHIEELSKEALASAIRKVVSPLPDVVDADEADR